MVKSQKGGSKEAKVLFLKAMKKGYSFTIYILVFCFISTPINSPQHE